MMDDGLNAMDTCLVEFSVVAIDNPVLGIHQRTPLGSGLDIIRGTSFSSSPGVLHLPVPCILWLCGGTRTELARHLKTQIIARGVSLGSSFSQGLSP